MDHGKGNGKVTMAQGSTILSNTAPLRVVGEDGGRKPGRPKGYPKSGGRKPGVKNRISADAKNAIIVDGRPLETLFQIAKGNRLKAADPNDPTKKAFVYPTLRERRDAATALLAKVIPDLKSQELTGDPAKPLFPAPETSSFEIGRRLAFLLAKGAEGLPTTAEPDKVSEDAPAARDFVAASIAPTRTEPDPPAVREPDPPPPFEDETPVIGARTLGQTYEISKTANIAYQGLTAGGDECWHVVERGMTKSVHNGPSAIDHAAAAARKLSAHA